MYPTLNGGADLPLAPRFPLLRFHSSVPLFAAAALLMAVPPVDAQSLTVEVSSAMQPSLSPASLWGGALTLGDVLAVRVGGALAERRSTSGSGGTSIGAWAMDLDLLLAPGPASSVRPYAFAGGGMLGRTALSGMRETGTSLSAGGGIMIPLLETFTIDASTRYRIPAGDTGGFSGRFPRGLEYRLGVGIRFGGGADSRGSAVGTRNGSSRGGTRFPAGSSRSTRAAAVLPTAERYLGVPYVWGGESPRSGFDCSGFTQYVFREHGVSLPRTSREQVYAGVGVTPSVEALRAGDLIMFAGNGSRIDHVAIYAGEGRIIHSTSSGGGVRYDDLYSQRGEYFRTHMVAARRVMDDGGSLVRALERSLNLVPVSFDPPDLAPRP